MPRDTRMQRQHLQFRSIIRGDRASTRIVSECGNASAFENVPISSGQRLAQHLLRTTARRHSTCQEKRKQRSPYSTPNNNGLVSSRGNIFDSATCTDLQLLLSLHRKVCPNRQTIACRPIAVTFATDLAARYAVVQSRLC
jgi:hypothetical protein